MKTFAELLKYDSWANDKILKSFEALPASSLPAYPVKLMGHILSTESAWVSRILGVQPVLPAWPELTLAECRFWLEKMLNTYLPIVERSESELERTINYKNNAGLDSSFTPQQMMMHVFTHGCYHRGQIAREMRLAGQEPVNTDYVTMLLSVR